MSTKEIGLPIPLTNGIHNGTEIRNGKLQLRELTTDSTGKIIYASKGTWESAVISIGDKVTAFERVVKSIIDSSSNTAYKIYTKSSSNNVNWSEYAEITYIDGKINSPVGLYAQIKIELSAALTPALLTIDEFTDGKYNTNYVSSSDGTLRLKRNIALSPTVSLHEDGFLYRTKFERNKLSKINGITFQ
ncbi:hypothetical protein [Paenibacillus sp. 1781tsa1]|uniref:hypothetical protein n=1 Tax=Paenibacillus sp. 1781tsa1 TaxID=2953810 RepID=UPI00209F5618|nr:hypothetical protein [Paenibacillus sp. 1781tsa1]MCP1185116.1 hypothetical protein [Paenibacillus sp. 1781tsa1]